MASGVEVVRRVLVVLESMRHVEEALDGMRHVLKVLVMLLLKMLFDDASDARVTGTSDDAFDDVGDGDGSERLLEARKVRDKGGIERVLLLRLF